MRGWFSGELETVATFWRIERKDGVTLGFTSHDRNVWFDGVLHRAAPGMLPSALRMSSGLEADSAEMAGALAHDAIREEDLAAGRYDGARIVVGLVDWERLENEPVYVGTLGAVGRDGASFSAELESLKSDLHREIVPRTAPSCRAEFCGIGCTLSAARFTHEAQLTAIADDRNAVRLATPVAAAKLADGILRWVDGPDAGLAIRIEGVTTDGWLLLDRSVAQPVAVGARAIVREGCDHRLETCTVRYANAVNFQGEPFLPGNDLLARYPSARA